MVNDWRAVGRKLQRAACTPAATRQRAIPNGPPLQNNEERTRISHHRLLDILLPAWSEQFGRTGASCAIPSYPALACANCRRPAPSTSGLATGKLPCEATLVGELATELPHLDVFPRKIAPTPMRSCR